MKRVFVSHANSEDDVERFIPRLCDRLKQYGLEVLIDRDRLLPGSGWRKEIYTWLSICHCAVVVISERALHEDSVWVPRETSLLMWRKSLDPRLTIIPVLGPGVTLDAVERSSKFADLQIRELQAISLAHPDEAIELVVAGLSRLGMCEKTPFDELVDLVASLLGVVGPQALEECEELLIRHTSEFDSVSDPVRRLAFRLLYSDFEHLMPAFNVLFSRSRAQARADLADVLAILGANWVDPEAAQWIAKESASRLAVRSSRVLVLNASTLFAAEMYLQRASLRPPQIRWPLIPITGISGETANEVVDEIEVAISAHMPLSPDPFDTNHRQRRKRQLSSMRKMGLPLFLTMRLPPNVDNLIAALSEYYSEANLLLLTGATLPDEREFPDDQFRLLIPAIADGVEEDARAALDTMNSAFRIPNHR